MCGAVCGLVRYDVPVLKLFDTRKVPKNRAEFAACRRQRGYNHFLSGRVICTPNTGYPVLGVHGKQGGIFSAFVIFQL